VVIQSALEQMLDRDLSGAFVRCRDFIITADIWYAADTLGEGVVGQALVRHFEPALTLADPWREDDNAWVRRAVGTGVHFWAKRSRGAAELVPQAKTLLAFLEPMWGEWEMDAVKGVGWGLKTLGRNYPDLMADWLPGQVNRRHRTLMLRKAVKGLSEEQRARLTAKA
jgi:3-methyladenine DNA glycosylase AlkD